MLGGRSAVYCGVQPAHAHTADPEQGLRSRRYAVVDLETTGGQPPLDKIIEVAVVLTDGHRVLDSFSSLVNPGRGIPSGVQHLTGITPGMVAQAPEFAAVARRVVEMTEGAVFVAHNAQFDYSFLRAAYQELGFSYVRRVLCTIRLARRLAPGQPSYSLGKLARGLGITPEARHRALGDAQTTALLLHHLLHSTPGPDAEAALAELVEAEIGAGHYPPQLKPEVVQALPDATGVYFFQDQQGRVIYVGKSVSIRRRVMSHLAMDTRKKDGQDFKQAIHQISYEITGSELIALLRESHEIKQLQPLFNRAQRRRTYPAGLYIQPDAQGYPRWSVRETPRRVRLDPTGHTGPVQLLESVRGSRGLLERLTEQFMLCPKLMGLESGHGPCFHYQIKKCLGACVGAEPAEHYALRADEARQSLAYPHRHFAIVGPGRHADEVSLVWVAHWQYQGYAFLQSAFTARTLTELEEAVATQAEVVKGRENRHVQTLIRGYLAQGTPDRVVVLS